MAPVLNLNNEVVKMRKDVKKARVLTIRRLTRHIGKLKLKKGSEDLKLKNQKRVERLIEEIHAMKILLGHPAVHLPVEDCFLHPPVFFQSGFCPPSDWASTSTFGR